MLMESFWSFTFKIDLKWPLQLVWHNPSLQKTLRSETDWSRCYLHLKSSLLPLS